MTTHMETETYSEPNQGKEEEERPLVKKHKKRRGKPRKHEEDNIIDNTSNISTTRQWMLLLALLVLQFLSLSIDTFLLPFFTEKALEKQLNEVQVGIIFSGYNMSRFFGAMFLVQWILGFSSRKVYAIGGILSAGCCVSFGLSALAPDGLWFFFLCLVIRIVAGVSSGCLTTVTTTTLLKSTQFTPSTVMACVEALVGAGYACGPAIGSLLYKYIGYTNAFMPLGGLMLVSTIITNFALPGDGAIECKSNGAEHDGSCSGLLRIVTIPGLALVFWSVIVLKISRYGCTVFISHFLISELGTDVSVPGVAFIGTAIVYSLFSIICAKLVDKLGLLWTQMVVGWIIVSVTFILIPPSPLLHFIFHDYRSATLSISMYVAQDIGQAALYVAPLQICLNIASTYGYRADDMKTYSMVSGLIHGGTSLGAGLAPVLSGIVNQYLNFDWYATGSAIMSAFMLLLTIIYLLAIKLQSPTEKHSKDGDGCSDPNDYDIIDD